jgi:hypothetical protein
VTAYEFHIPAEPAWDDHEKLVGLGGNDLPERSPVVSETTTCMVWHTPDLRPLIGTEYAEGTTITEEDTAEMKAVSRPRC